MFAGDVAAYVMGEMRCKVNNERGSEWKHYLRGTPRQGQ